MCTPKHSSGPPKRQRVTGAALSDHATEQTESEALEEADGITPSDDGSVPVVGLGGSAGGLVALQSFFAQMPTENDMAFIVVLHLSPEHESNLAAILQRVTTMPVIQVNETTLLEINHVYVIPPAKHLTISKGRLNLSAMERQLGRHVAVDLLFRSLADHHGPRAMAVVLSGADGDGCIGIKRVKERGGLTVAQNPQEAEQDSMPRTAIATKMVDWVLPVAEIPGRLLEYRRREKLVRLPAETTPADPQPPDEDVREKALRDVLSLLHVRLGHDFSYYKRATVLRRVGRRMQVNGIDEMAAYLEFLRFHPGEAGALQQDFLISVTNFFRDPEAFAALESEIPRLFQGKQGDDTVRVWVAGCATGEEAYSVAMLLREYAEKMDAPPKLQVFATDLDESAIQTARAGIYPKTIVADVSAVRLQRFFTKHTHGYRVQSALREIVLFALHDLLKDPPFSRLDLVTCRNLLIYLNRDAQGRAFDVFHYGLADRGLLMLSTSESADEAARLFEPLDKKHRLYVRNAAPRPSLPLPVGRPAFASIQPSPQDAVAAVAEDRGRASDDATALSASQTSFAPARGETRAGSWGELHLKLRDTLVPPTVIIDAGFQVVHLSQGAERFVHLGSGKATLDILRLVHPMLRHELRAILFRAAETRADVQVRDVPLEIGETPSVVRLQVRPAEHLAPGHMIVVFEESLDVASETASVINRSPDAATRHLEDALERLNSQQRESVEQYEASTEELKSANEELQSRNEELHSATEELDTGREELQSINEELTTLNQEMKSKVDELAQANGDLQNLMASTNIATVFLDRQLCIQRYTPTALALFNLIPADTGRPLSDLTHRLDYPDIMADASRALEQLGESEKEIQGLGGNWWLARMQPYRSPPNQIAGVVLTFVDITKRKKAEDALRQSEAEFRQLADAMPQIVWAARPDGTVDYCNKQWYEFTGVPPGTIGNAMWETLAHPDDLPVMNRCWAASVATGKPYEMEYRFKRASDRTYCWFLSRARPAKDSDGRIVRWFGTSTDISERKETEKALAATAERLRLAMDAAHLGTWDWNMETSEVLWSPEHNAMFDLPLDQQQGNFEDGMRHVHPDDREKVVSELQTALAERRDSSAEMRSIHRDGSLHWIVASGHAVYDGTGKPLRMIGVVQDITVRIEAETALRQSEERFRLANLHSPFPVMLYADDGEVLQVNDAWIHLTGYTVEELTTVADWIERAFRTKEARDEVRQFLADFSQYIGAIQRSARRVRCADGEERIWDVSHANLGRLPDGRWLRIATAIDVTERHHDEAVLRVAKEEAEKANRAKSEFLSRMSHELRTPLNAILGFGQILALTPLEEQGTQCVDHILKGGKHLLGLIDEVLDLARVEAGELALKPAAIAVDKLLRECVEFVTKMAEVRKVTCRVNLRRARQVPIWADEQRFRQVLLNLLGNAIKYNREGGQVNVSCQQMPNGQVRVSIKDTGAGIAPEDLARLFVPFERLGQEYGDVEGTGLGLVVSKQLVEAMGGTLGARSEVGHGSTFWVELPTVSDVATDRDSNASATLGPAMTRADSSPATLLYVEDNLSNLQVLKTVVERLRPHWTLLSAKDGQSGLDLARKHLPDLILLDLQLPGLKGDEVLSALRNDPTTVHLPVLMLSADATAHSRERLLALGANDHSPKPFNVHELLEKLERMLLDTRQKP